MTNLTTSKFGLAFQQAAEESGVAYDELFDTSVIEISTDDLQVFLEQLALKSITL